ncbi:MAG: hypothetical protein ACXVB9_02295 [Bdellovibrionota bacterium]
MRNLAKLGALILVLCLSVVAPASAFDPGFHPGPGFHHGPDFHPGFGPGFRPGFGPGFRPGFGPGFRPGFIPGPGWVPGPGFAPGYVFTCYAVNNVGQSFFGTSMDPNLAQNVAMQYCFGSGGLCQPVGCQ